ncbi:exo-beta-1,3-glucanase [Coprinopsis marcescibilis]|uniref:glucan 1,3-beta-glucosidase n=1 Tax=Coprinopsis marcescibilis TaxID=230819 RepID=A0A5C3KQ69_COPMA|nr:exo-beta-1,3-glucanase [Coprinopsis marcescibilis]
MSNGTTFRYRNNFGGIWVHDPEDPFNLDAQPNNWTPPLNTTWRWGVDRIFGVNLGGWFVLEPFINPGIFQRYPGAVDEYTLCELMRAEGEAGGPGLRALEEHYETFITEQDIAEIAAAGLNWMRIPIGYWAIETFPGEPFLERTSWTYFLRVVEWARKYGIRIYLDLHALPGSQNVCSFRLSFPRLRRLGFLHGNMGIANGQRVLYYLRILAEFVSQPEYRDVIPMLGFVNEPDSRDGAIGQEPLRSFYLEAYNIIREATGYGEGNGPYLVFGDGFRATTEWEGFMPGADRLIMDIHPYLAFDDNNTPDLLTEVAPDGELGGVWPLTACTRWGGYFNRTKRMHGMTIGGEFSAAINDCGLYIREVGVDSPHPLCDLYNAWEEWTPEMKEGLRNFILASFDAIGDFFWWTWRIGDSIDGRVTAPFWSYKLGRDNGWMPEDPRTSVGKCLALGLEQDPFVGPFLPNQIGQEPTPTIAAEYIAANPWPPLAIANLSVDISLLPTYATAGPIITMPVPTYSGAPSSATASVDGWFNHEDTTPGIARIPGCAYPDTYDGEFEELPTEPCTGA